MLILPDFEGDGINRCEVALESFVGRENAAAKDRPSAPVGHDLNFPASRHRWDVEQLGPGTVGTRPEIIAAYNRRADLFEWHIRTEIADTRIGLDVF